MPIIDSLYKASGLFRNGHIQSIYPSLFRNVDFKYDYRERIDTTDGDFLDLDWKKNGSGHLIIISHGLEGNSHRTYVRGMAKKFSDSGYDILAWNYRSCSGEMNRLARLYHSGDSADLAFIIDKVRESYHSISLIGFSLGGNLSLVYLGRSGNQASGLIKSSVVISVPCDLEDSAIELAKWSRKIYMKRFLKMFKKKLDLKEKKFPELFSTANYKQIKSFKDFDDRYTSRIHGFKNAKDYWEKSSATRYLEGIKVPVLILSAANDPFLGQRCYPHEFCKNSKELYLEMPDYGGHVGFYLGNDNYFSEIRCFEFISEGK